MLSAWKYLSYCWVFVVFIFLSNNKQSPQKLLEIATIVPAVLFSFGFYFSCGSQLLQRVWEADLEACQLLIRGFQLKETSCYVFEEEENQMDEMEMTAHGPSDSEKRKEGHYPKGTEWGPIPCSKHSEMKEVSEIFHSCISSNIAGFPFKRKS